MREIATNRRLLHIAFPGQSLGATLEWFINTDVLRREIAPRPGEPSPTGLLVVSDVDPDSQLLSAGVGPGMGIVRANDRPLFATHASAVRDLQHELRAAGPTRLVVVDLTAALAGPPPASSPAGAGAASASTASASAASADAVSSTPRSTGRSSTARSSTAATPAMRLSSLPRRVTLSIPGPESPASPASPGAGADGLESLRDALLSEVREETAAIQAASSAARLLSVPVSAMAERAACFLSHAFPGAHRMRVVNTSFAERNKALLGHRRWHARPVQRNKTSGQWEARLWRLQLSPGATVPQWALLLLGTAATELKALQLCDRAAAARDSGADDPAEAYHVLRRCAIAAQCATARERFHQAVAAQLREREARQRRGEGGGRALSFSLAPLLTGDSTATADSGQSIPGDVSIGRYCHVESTDVAGRPVVSRVCARELARASLAGTARLPAAAAAPDATRAGSSEPLRFGDLGGSPGSPTRNASFVSGDGTASLAASDVDSFRYSTSSALPRVHDPRRPLPVLRLDAVDTSAEPAHPIIQRQGSDAGDATPDGAGADGDGTPGGGGGGGGGKPATVSSRTGRGPGTIGPALRTGRTQRTVRTGRVGRTGRLSAGRTSRRTGRRRGGRRGKAAAAPPPRPEDEVLGPLALETSFRVVLVSDVFEGLGTAARLAAVHVALLDALWVPSGDPSGRPMLPGASTWAHMRGVSTVGQTVRNLRHLRFLPAKFVIEARATSEVVADPPVRDARAPALNPSSAQVARWAGTHMSVAETMRFLHAAGSVNVDPASNQSESRPGSRSSQPAGRTNNDDDASGAPNNDPGTSDGPRKQNTSKSRAGRAASTRLGASTRGASQGEIEAAKQRKRQARDNAMVSEFGDAVKAASAGTLSFGGAKRRSASAQAKHAIYGSSSQKELATERFEKTRRHMVQRLRVIQRWWRARHQRQCLSVLLRQHRAATALSRLFRGHAARQFVIALRAVRGAMATEIQRVYRGVLDRRFAAAFRKERTHASVNVQRVFRGHLGREYAKWKRINERAALTVQRTFRGHSARKRVRTLRATTYFTRVLAPAVGVMQRIARGHLARSRVRRMRYNVHLRVRRHDAAVNVQRMWRGVLGRRRAAALARENAAAVSIQKRWRGIIGRRAADRHLERAIYLRAVRRIQRVGRGYIARQYVRSLRNTTYHDQVVVPAATSLQALYRGFATRKRLEGRKHFVRSAGRVARWWKAILATRRAQQVVRDARTKKRSDAATLIQSVVRRSQAVVFFKQLRRERGALELMAVRVLQRVWRGYLSSRRATMAYREAALRRGLGKLLSCDEEIELLLEDLRDCLIELKELRRRHRLVQTRVREIRVDRDTWERRLPVIAEERKTISHVERRQGWHEAYDTEEYIIRQSLELSAEELLCKRRQASDLADGIEGLQLEREEIDGEIARVEMEMVHQYDELRQVEMSRATRLRKSDLEKATRRVRIQFAVKNVRRHVIERQRREKEVARMAEREQAAVKDHQAGSAKLGDRAVPLPPDAPQVHELSFVAAEKRAASLMPTLDDVKQAAQATIDRANKSPSAHDGQIEENTGDGNDDDDRLDHLLRAMARSRHGTRDLPEDLRLRPFAQEEHDTASMLSRRWEASRSERAAPKPSSHAVASEHTRSFSKTQGNATLYRPSSRRQDQRATHDLWLKRPPLATKSHSERLNPPVHNLSASNALDGLDPMNERDVARAALGVEARRARATPGLSVESIEAEIADLEKELAVARAEAMGRQAGSTGKDGSIPLAPGESVLTRSIRSAVEQDSLLHLAERQARAKRARYALVGDSRGERGPRWAHDAEGTEGAGGSLFVHSAKARARNATLLEPISTRRNVTGRPTSRTADISGRLEAPRDPRADIYRPTFAARDRAARLAGTRDDAGSEELSDLGEEGPASRDANNPGLSLQERSKELRSRLGELAQGTKDVVPRLRRLRLRGGRLPSTADAVQGSTVAQREHNGPQKGASAVLHDSRVWDSKVVRSAVAREVNEINFRTGVKGRPGAGDDAPVAFWQKQQDNKQRARRRDRRMSRTAENETDERRGRSDGAAPKASVEQPSEGQDGHQLEDGAKDAAGSDGDPRLSGDGVRTDMRKRALGDALGEAKRVVQGGIDGAGPGDRTRGALAVLGRRGGLTEGEMTMQSVAFHRKEARRAAGRSKAEALRARIEARRRAANLARAQGSDALERAVEDMLAATAIALQQGTVEMEHPKSDVRTSATYEEDLMESLREQSAGAIDPNEIPPLF